MIPRLFALAVVLMAGTALAQAISPLTGPADPVAPSTLGAGAAPRRHSPTIAERFDRANTTHDGRLTRAQAWAGHMNAVARDFAAIDAGHKGYVTMDDIQAHAKARRTARHPVAEAE